MRKPTYYQLFYADFLIFAVLFILHRAFTFTALNAQVLTGARQWSGFFVGTLSDLWIAGLLALLSAAWHGLLGLKFTAGTVQKLRALFFLSAALLLASHQSYVEFFGFTMMAFHLRYLYDSAFILANGQSLFSWPLAVYLGVLALALLLQSGRRKESPRRYQGVTFAAVLLTLVILHNRNIHWRVQWFIPENLQVNLLEKLFLQLSKSKAIEPVSAAERERLLTLLRLPHAAPDFPGLMRQVKENPAGPLHPIDGKIREHWQASLASQRKPLLAVVLLESLRPAETGYFAPDSPSLTPTLDKLAASSIVFTNAYSTGSVTRGGQEAVFCGHISSRDTSLMRYDAVAPISCLSDLLQKPLPDGRQVETFWHHGGNGLFDNQLSFWRKHGMQRIMTQDDFAKDAPQTSWGVGDITFLQESARELKQRREVSTAAAQVGMLLTLSNHIPWDLPPDVIPWAMPMDAKHLSYRTTAYTDHALRLFMENLKTDGLWDDALIIFVSDHGNQIPAYQDIYPDRPTAVARLQSHINFIIAGGLAEKALRDLGLNALPRDVLVSQVDISQFLADTLGLKEFSSMGENPFHDKRLLPVLSRLEQHLFDPQSQSLIDPSAWQTRPLFDVTAMPDEASIETKERNLLFYRSYIDYISTK
jgi:hypothetical protein